MVFIHDGMTKYIIKCATFVLVCGAEGVTLGIADTAVLAIPVLCTQFVVRS